MSKFDVEIVGRRRKPNSRGTLLRLFGLLGRVVRGLLMRPRLLFVSAVIGFVLLVGTPHVAGEYACRDPFRTGQLCRSVLYCAYYGVQGRRVEFPPYGENCKLVTFLPIDWQRVKDSETLKKLAVPIQKYVK